MLDKPLTTRDVAEYCHVTPVGVQQWIKAGKLKAYTTPGGHYRIQKRDFKKFLEKYGMPIDEAFFSDGTVRKLLVVDDEPNIVELVIRLLSTNGGNYRFASAYDGYEAGLQVASFKPELVLLDLMMPRVDGFEVCRKIKTSPDTSHIKVLVITGYLEETNIQKIAKCGADDWLAKPLKAVELKNKVAQLLGEPVQVKKEAR